MLKNVKELENFIKKEYDIDIQNIEKSKESTDGNVYIINANEYVIKIYNDMGHTKSMINLHEYLVDNNFYVPKIIKDKNGFSYIKHEDKFIVIYSFLEGIQIKKLENFSGEVIVNMANELRRFHDMTNENKFFIKENPIANKIVTDRYSILHFDLTKDNIFYNEKTDKIGFIDFDDSRYGASIFDVSILIALLFISKKYGINNESIKLFIDSYYKDDTELKQKEIPLIKECAINWIDYILDNNQFDTSTNESFEIKKKLIGLLELW